MTTSLSSEAFERNQKAKDNTKTRMTAFITNEVQDIRRNWTFVVQLVI